MTRAGLGLNSQSGINFLDLLERINMTIGIKDMREAWPIGALGSTEMTLSKRCTEARSKSIVKPAGVLSFIWGKH